MVRVLCFGDSLTEGYTFKESREFMTHPYSIALRRLLQDHGSAEVVTAGVSGERVVPSMTPRLDRILNEAAQPYDWVIILGGTNDICSDLRAEDFLPSLLGLHDRAKKNGSTRTVALALPQFLYELTLGKEDHRREKAKVNEGLKAYSEGSGGSTLWVDLWNGLPFGSLPQEERALYWVDGAHMTPRGYDRMAGLIFDCLNQHLDYDVCLAKPSY